MQDDKMKFKLSDMLAVRKIENEIFVFNRQDSRIHCFNDTGAFLWECVKKTNDSTKIIQFLLDAYEIDNVKAENDTIAFLEQLRDVGLVEII